MSYQEKTKAAAAFLRGLGLGTGFMYAFDPDKGARRRGVARDKVVHSGHAAAEGIEVALRDLGHRAEGLFARARAHTHRDRASNEVLEQRVRTKLGRYVTHPRSILVSASDGNVTLRGPILADELETTLRAAKRVRGVKTVDDHLEPHEAPENIPGLQGDVGPKRPRAELLQTNWAPAVRLLVGVAGAASAIYGTRRKRTIRGALASAVGSVLVTRAITNLPIRRLVGVGAGRRGIDLHKTIKVAAPIEEVFRFWTHLENFPRFMEHVQEVTITGRDRSHWKVTGLTGRWVEWDAEITKLVPNKIFAWKTLPGADVEHSGVVHFEANADKSTRLDIRMAYRPPAGALGHVVASLFRKDPKTALDEDLVRMKSLLEEGKTTAHGEAVTREELH